MIGLARMCSGWPTFLLDLATRRSRAERGWVGYDLGTDADHVAFGWCTEQSGEMNGHRARQLSCSMRSRREPAGPGLGVVEGHVPADPLEVPLVLGHEDAACLATRQRQQDVVGERLRHPANLEPLRSCHVREQVARTMPDAGRGRQCPPRSLEHAEDVTLERLPVPLPPHAGSQFLSHDDTEILERRVGSMESLQGVVGRRVAKRVDEQLSVEYSTLGVVRVTARGPET